MANRRFASAALLALMSTFMLAPTPAHAASSDCSSGEVCFWDDAGFTDTRKDRTTSLAHFSDIGFNDKTSATYNRMSVAWVLYDDTNYTDSAVCLKSGASVSNLGNYGFGDKTSSAKKRSDNTCPSGSKVFYGAN